MTSKSCWIWVGGLTFLLFALLYSGVQKRLKDIENEHRQGLFIPIYRLEREEAGLDKDMPKYSVYKEETLSSPVDKFGDRYGKLLVAIENNEEWWKWSWKNRHKYIKGDLFSEILSRDENSGPSYLREECKKVYEIVDSSIDREDLSNTWRFCSPLGKRPFTLKDLLLLNSKGKFGSIDNEYAHYLISNRPLNKNTWLELYKNLIENKTLEEYEDSFKGVKEGYSNDSSKDSLNNVCERAYSKSKEEVENNTIYKKSVFKFCSLLSYVG